MALYSRELIKCDTPREAVEEHFNLRFHAIRRDFLMGRRLSKNDGGSRA